MSRFRSFRPGVVGPAARPLFGGPRAIVDESHGALTFRALPFLFSFHVGNFEPNRSLWRALLNLDREPEWIVGGEPWESTKGTSVFHGPGDVLWSTPPFVDPLRRALSAVAFWKDPAGADDVGMLLREVEFTEATFVEGDDALVIRARALVWGPVGPVDPNDTERGPSPTVAVLRHQL